ncbi:MAG: O-antigen ligase family protein, partial [Anaerolineales bacterium]
GILIIVLPLLVASTWSFLKRKHSVLTIVSGVLSVFLIFGLLLTSSRGAWIGLFIATTGSIGVLAVNKVRPSLPKINNAVIIMAVFLAGIAFVFGLWSAQDSLKQILQTITSGGSRITLLQQSYLLLNDFPIIGAGLQTFSGLYSRLILLVPVEFFHYAHNLYIDLSLEQGIPGLITFLFFLSGSLVISIKSLVKPIDFKVQPFAIASFVGIVAMMFHGIFDDPIYGQAGTPLLFIAPGIAMAVYSSQIEAPHRATLFSALRSDRLRKVMVPLAGILVLLLLLVIGAPKVQSIWSSNIGAVGMSKAELEDWPHVSWQGTNSQHAGLIDARSAIERAIKLDPNNRTALYRMGLLAMKEGDFHRATDYLEIAFDLAPMHRGIIKSLGYSYLWSGRTPQAMSLLLRIPESRYELGVYSWWWETQGEMDLASEAINMASALEESGAPLTSNPFVEEYSDWAGGSY